MDKSTNSDETEEEDSRDLNLQEGVIRIECDETSIQNMDIVFSEDIIDLNEASTSMDPLLSELDIQNVTEIEGGEVAMMLEENEQQLTVKFLSGQLSFSEYASLMEDIEEDVEDNTLDPQKIVLEESVEKKEEILSKCGTLGRKRRSRRNVLPPALQGLMGEANMRYARGDRESAEKLCLEIIRQVPTAPEPFRTLAILYEELGFSDKSLQFALIAAHLRPNDANQWIRLGVMSEEKGDIKQAITCFSKAIAVDRNNIDTHFKVISLMEIIGDKKGALRSYLRLLSILKPEQGDMILQLSKEVAHKFHEFNDYHKAKEALNFVFEKCPHLVDSEEVNLMLELLLLLNDYKKALEILIKYCNIKISSKEEGDIPDKTIKIVDVDSPGSVALDIFTKLCVVVIRLKSFEIIPKLLKFLFSKGNPEEDGDLYLDIAEALMSEGRFRDALELLNPLVDSQNYSLAAVWLRHGECLKSCGMIEAAVVSYRNVVELAPQHLDARLILSDLLKRLGESEEALTVLTQDENSEVLDPGLLYERCLLLKGNDKKMDEYLAVGQLLLSRHCIQIQNREEVDALARKCFKNKQYRLLEIRCMLGDPQEGNAPSFVQGPNEPSLEDELKLLLDLLLTCLKIRNYSLMQRLCFSALGSKRFCSSNEIVRQLELNSVLTCIYNNDSYYGFNMTRAMIFRYMNYNRLWNLLGLVISRADDFRHNRFIMRLLSKRPNFLPLMILHANNCLVSGTYKYALDEYAFAYRLQPSPELAFMLGITFFQIACQKFSVRKHSLVLQGLAFFSKYKEMREKECSSEVNFNFGRAFHQLGILPLAVHHYNQVLEESGKLNLNQKIVNLKREAAYNLHLIYLSSGSRQMARYLIEKYIVV